MQAQIRDDFNRAQEIVAYLVRKKIGKKFNEINVFTKWWSSPPRGRSGAPRLRSRCFVWDQGISAMDLVRQDRERAGDDGWDVPSPRSVPREFP